MKRTNTFNRIQLMSAALVLSFISAFNANAQLTLRDAVQRAMQVNSGIKSAQMTLESKESSVGDSWGKMMPTISIDATYTHMNDDLVLDLNPIRSAMIQLEAKDQVSLANIQSVLQTGSPLSQQQQQAVAAQATQKLEAAISSFKQTVKEQNFPQGIVSIKQPIFVGGKILAGIKASEAQTEIAKSKLKDQNNTICSSVITAYLNLLLAEKNLEVRNDVLSGIRKHSDRANSLLLQGLIAKSDKLRADVALAEAERNQYEASEKKKIAAIVLQSLLESNDDNISLKDSLSFKDININENSFVDNSKNENPNIVALRGASKALTEKANAEHGSYYPSVFGFGFYNVFDHYLVKDMEPKWGFGLGAHWDVFDGLQRNHKYEEAKAEVQAMEYMTKETQRKIELLVRSKIMNINLAREQYNRLDKSLEQAEENKTLNERRFEEGLGTSLEALDAELALEGIKLQRVAALNEYYCNLADLFQASGNAEGFIEFWSK